MGIEAKKIKIPIYTGLKVDVKNFFDYDSIPEYWTVLNICY